MARGVGLKRIAVIAEDVSHPLDEGFKRASFEIASSIARTGIETTLFTHFQKDLPIHTEPLPRNRLLAGLSFSRSLRAYKPDAVLYIPRAAATPMSLMRARLLRVQSGGVAVAVLSLQRRAYRAGLRPFLRLIRPLAVLVLSERSTGVMRQAGIRAQRIPLGVNTQVFRPPRPGEKEALREKYGIRGGRVILHVGHISPRRNLSLLRRLIAEGINLVVVSSTSTRLDARIEELLQHPSITLIDRFIEDIDEVYRLADAYVFPTFSHRGAIEIPLSVLEALATNLPVVTTDFGGIPDILDERNGLFICSSEEEFMSKSEEMLAIGAVDTRTLVSDLTWDNVARAIIDIIESEIE
jgi:glycosyltransferase involved in cell wall biosynthesis